MARFINPGTGDACFISAAYLADPPQEYIDNMAAVYITADGSRYVSDGSNLVPLAQGGGSIPVLSAKQISYEPSGVDAVTTDVEEKLRQTISANDFGASSDSTKSENKAALQLAISDLNVAGGGYLVVPGNVDYGFINTDLSTYPDFTGANSDLAIIDYGPGDADGSGNKAGSQIREFFYTAQTIPAGLHDGNGHRIYGAWAPYYYVTNTANLGPVGSPSRTASDNRRASYFFGNDTEATWRLGQGTLAGAALTNEELSNFVLEHYQANGDTLPAYAPLIIERKTGNWSIGSGTNAPESSYHFKSITLGYTQALFESLTTTSIVGLRTSGGSGDDASLRNAAGDLQLHISSQGAALNVTKSNRRVWVTQSLQLKATALTYGTNISINSATGNQFLLTPTDGVGFNVLAPSNSITGAFFSLTIINSFGVLGVVSFASVFKMNTWIQPANGFNRTIHFQCYDGVNWRAG